MDCKCNKCMSACSRKPGWFMPWEVETTAKNMGETLESFFEKYLAVDYMLPEISGDKPIYILSPSITSIKPGSLFPMKPGGRCIFFIGGLCLIHEHGKPYECMKYDHTKSSIDVQIRHGREIPEAWIERQGLIERVYNGKLLVVDDMDRWDHPKELKEI